MTIGVTGPNGYIGSALVKAGALSLECDVTNVSQIEEAIEKNKPDFVFHLAAKSKVSFCEQNPDEAMFINVIGTRNVAEVCMRANIGCAMLSTYQIWNGSLFEKRKENSKMTPAKNRYGMMKAAAEALAIDYGMKVIRTSYVFDEERLSDKLNKLKNGESIVEPAFLFRSFIYLRHFLDLAQTYFVNFESMPNVLHLAGRKTASWYNFMRDVSNAYGFDRNLVRARYIEDYSEYPRPWNGRLDVSKAIAMGFPDYDYEIGIAAMAREKKLWHQI